MGGIGVPAAGDGGGPGEETSAQKIVPPKGSSTPAAPVSISRARCAPTTSCHGEIAGHPSQPSHFIWVGSLPVQGDFSRRRVRVG